MERLNPIVLMLAISLELDIDLRAVQNDKLFDFGTVPLFQK